MTEQLTYEKEHGLLWKDVYEQMVKSPQEIADFIAANDSSLWSESPMQSQQTYREMLYEAQQFVELRESVEGGLSKLIENFTNLNDIMTVSSNPDEIKKSMEGTSSSKVASPSSFVGTKATATSTSGTSANSAVNAYGNTDDDLLDWHRGSIDDVDDLEIIGNDVEYFGGRMSIDDMYDLLMFQGKTELAQQLRAGNVTGRNVLRYASGGLASSTGLAWLDGTKERPEAVFDADATSIIQALAQRFIGDQELMQTLDNSITDSLKQLRTLMESDISSTLPTIDAASGDTVIIEHAEVNMNVQQMSSDYDARQAGDAALQEMLRIAKKSTINNRIGR